MSIFSKFKPISISLSPNVQKDDVILALKLLFQPWKWSQGNVIRKFEQEFARYLGVKYAFSFNSGRSAFHAILKALNLKEGSDVLLQAFTCNAVPNPVLWTGLNPVYIDCADDFNISAAELEKGLGGHPEVLVVQHTFGLPANVEALELIVRQKGVIMLEDCAHALGAQINGKKVGVMGKAGFFSFSRDKVISSVYGGMAVTSDDQLGQKLEQLQKEFGQPSMFWIFQQIVHPILMYCVVLPLYTFLDLGKIFLIVSQWFHILSKAVNWQEKRGQKPDYFPKALPNVLAAMAQHQFKKLETFNIHREKMAEFYYNELRGSAFGLPKKDGNIFLRFTITHPKAHEIMYEAWHKENILLGDWYTSVIAPWDTQLDKMRYNPGSCPNAENLAQKTLNLPTHINVSMEDAKRVVNFLKKFTQ